ncbi:nuclear transport factor 2 family protein [Pseudomonas sp.]|uniref:nuclear transport factor 2 family protein n=2 Tax=unclassified Pseudomonas TaxID=196821 RepID=UPI0028B0CB76|nr:nuclear transport factor 2 family protein [Pseudomonas sp.]
MLTLQIKIRGFDVMTHRIEQRLAVLEAQQAIQALKHRYCQLCDLHYDADAIALLFTEDASWESGGRGRFVGREAIRTFFLGANQLYPWAAHLVLNAIITVNGDEATGQWRMLMPCNVLRDGQSVGVLQCSEYQERYQCVDGAWLIKCLIVTHRRIESRFTAWE